MRVRATLSVMPAEALVDAALPITVDVEGVVLTLDRAADDGLRLIIERTVDPAALELVADSGTRTRSEDGTEKPLPAVKVPESGMETVVARDLTSALSFLVEKPLDVRGLPGAGELIPEGAEEEALLDRFGTRRQYVPTSATLSIRTMNPLVTADNVRALLDRASGVRIYTMALAHGTAAARFREMWRVLEAAFRLKDNELVAALGSYQPAIAMDFTPEEIKELHTLRGRASHAESRGGVHELEHVERECGNQIARLSCLAERVILTKKSWGFPTLAVEELTPLRAYIARGGGVALR